MLFADATLLALVVHCQQTHDFANYLHVGDDAGAAAFAAALAGNSEPDFVAAVADALAEVGRLPQGLDELPHVVGQRPVLLGQALDVALKLGREADREVHT